MNDLESELKDTLERHAGPTGPRKLPYGTRAKVRRRQVVSGASALTITAAFVAACVALLLVGRAGSDQPKPSGTFVPAAGAAIPPDGWPQLTPGAGQAFIDEALMLYDVNPTGITSPVSILASGSVDGRSWLVTGFQTDGAGDWGGAAGPCGNLFVQHDAGNEAQPMFGVCLAPQTGGGSSLPAARMEGAVAQPLHLTMYFGIVSSQVSRVEVRSDGYPTWEPDLIAGPPGSPERYFVLFPPPKTDGVVVAFGSTGDVLGRLPLCASGVVGSTSAPAIYACQTPR